MRLPRLRIAHQLSLLIAAAVLLAVLVVGGLSLWSLRSGFSEYLRARDDEQLTRFMQLVERRSAADPTMAWLRDNREAMRDLMDEFNGRPALTRLVDRRPPPLDEPPRNPEDRPPRADAPAHPPPPEARDRRPPPPPQAGPPDRFAERVLIRDPQGRRLAGRPQPPGARDTVRAVKVNGVEVAFIELVAGPQPEGVDARFLQRQTAGLAGAALGTVLVMMLAGWWVAGRWSRPLRALQRATHDIASGHRTRRLQPAGALEIAQLMDDVNAMTAELARLEAARRLWIAQISHELRTPLAVLRGEIESIEDGARQPTREVMASLRDEVLQLNRLVDDLHTLSMADLEGLRCTFTDGDAHAVLLRAARRFQAQAAQRGLRLELPVADAPAIHARWDFGRVEQLLDNLLANSLRYTAAPGVVQVGWRSDSRELVLTVDDSAPGVSPADLPQLFEPLFRVDRARQRAGAHDGVHGSGLGLSIVRTIAAAHRGSATASSSARGGLRLCVRLPLQPEGEDA